MTLYVRKRRIFLRFLNFALRFAIVITLTSVHDGR